MKSKCYIQLGKHGDLMVLLPGFKLEFEQTGERPVVMVSREFSSTLKGVSYVRRWEVDLHWFGDCDKARAMAEKEFGKYNVVMPKWWDDPTHTPPGIRKDPQALIVHGKKMEIEKGDWFSYMASQWKYAGFPENRIKDPVVFDVRNLEAEAEMAKMVFRTGKPKLLVCLNTGGSSPFPGVAEVEQMIYQFRDRFEIIDLMKVRAPHIFDLLGLYERADFLITTDTATLHLAGACKIPYLAYIANGGGGSITRGNCIREIRYGNCIPQINSVLLDLKTALARKDGIRAAA